MERYKGGWRMRRMGCEVKTIRLSGFVLQNSRPSALNDEEEQKPGIRLVSMCFPPSLRTRTSCSNREKRAENTRRAAERSPGQQSKAGPGASHRPPHLRHPLKSSLLTARTEPPSPSPAASLSNRRGEPRCAAEIKGEDPGGGLDGLPAAARPKGSEGAPGRMDGCSRSLTRSHRDSFFLSSWSFSTESHQQRLRPRDPQEATPTQSQANIVSMEAHSTETSRAKRGRQDFRFEF